MNPKRKATPSSPKRPRSRSSVKRAVTLTTLLAFTIAIVTLVLKYSGSGTIPVKAGVASNMGGTSNTANQKNVDASNNTGPSQNLDPGSTGFQNNISSVQKVDGTNSNLQNVKVGKIANGDVNVLAPGATMNKGPSPKELRDAVKEGSPSTNDFVDAIKPELSKAAQGLENVIKENQDKLEKMYRGGFAAVPLTPELKVLPPHSTNMVQLPVDWPSVYATPKEGSEFELHFGFVDEQTQVLIERTFYLNREDGTPKRSEENGVPIEARILNPGEDSPVVFIGVSDAPSSNSAVNTDVPRADNSDNTGNSTGLEGAISAPLTDGEGTGGGSTAVRSFLPPIQDNGTSVSQIAPPSVQPNGTSVGNITPPIGESTGDSAGKIILPLPVDPGDTAGPAIAPPTESTGTGAGTVPPVAQPQDP